MKKLLKLFGLYTIDSHPDTGAIIERMRNKGHNIYPPMDLTIRTPSGEIIGYDGRWLRSLAAGETFVVSTDYQQVLQAQPEPGVAEVLEPMTEEEAERFAQYGDDADKMKELSHGTPD